MLSVYIITAIVGGVFVLLSAFGGDQDVHSGADHDLDHDVDHDVDHDADHDVDHDADHGADHDADHDADATSGDAEVQAPEHVADGAAADTAIWLPFFSTRFWTYFFTFFGVTGLVLTPFALSGLATALIASGMGTTTGLGIAYGFRYLKQHTVQSGTGVADIIGAEGLVLVRVSNDQIGKIRCRIKGKDTDLIASTDEDEPLPIGERVLVVGFEGTTAQIVRMPYIKSHRRASLQVEPSSKRG